MVKMCGKLNFLESQHDVLGLRSKGECAKSQIGRSPLVASTSRLRQPLDTKLSDCGQRSQLQGDACLETLVVIALMGVGRADSIITVSNRKHPKRPACTAHTSHTYSSARVGRRVVLSSDWDGIGGVYRAVLGRPTPGPAWRPTNFSSIRPITSWM